MSAATTISMESLLQDSPLMILPIPGELIEGTVISVRKNRILVDIGGVISGIISGKETKDSKETIKDLKVGDLVTSLILEEENEEGLIVLSLRRASQQTTWQNFVTAYEDKNVIDVVAKEANKGGLLLEVDGIKGFIPVSQLAPMNYPRVDGADASLILKRLERLVGKNFKVRIINIDKDNGKLILSEKAAMAEQRQDSLKKLKVGQKVKGKISGIVKFGIFVSFNGLEGLVHISEIAWGHVKNPGDYGRPGDEVEVLVIGVEGEKISLSMKRLTTDPWLEAAKTFSLGKVVEGVVNRTTPFGAFIRLTEDINGLVHLSELSYKEVKDPSDVVRVGEKVTAKVISVDAEEHRIGLSLKLEKIEKENKKETPKKEEEKTKSDDSKKSDSLADTLDISEKIAKSLETAGYKTTEDLKKATKEELIALEGLGEKTAEKILEKVQ